MVGAGVVGATEGVWVTGLTDGIHVSPGTVGLRVTGAFVMGARVTGAVVAGAKVVGADVEGDPDGALDAPGVVGLSDGDTDGWLVGGRGVGCGVGGPVLNAVGKPPPISA